MKRLVLSFVAVVVLSLVLVLPKTSTAEESATNQVKDSAGDASTKVKKVARTTKRKMRKATGQDTVVDDAKDHMHDAGDAVKNSTEKANRQGY